MSRKNRLWLIIGTGIVITLVVVAFFMRTTLVCCVLPPTGDYFTGTAVVAQNQTTVALRATASVIVALNQTTEAFLHQTETAYPNWGFVFTSTPLPYDPTLYAQRRQEELMLRTGAGPTQYTVFFATEAALIANYQGTALPTLTPAIASPTPILQPTPPPYDATLYAQRRIEEERIKTNTGPIYTAEYFYATETALVETYQGTALPTTPPPYDANLYARRQREIEIFKTAGGPTEWAIFVATETALVATYQGTVLPTFTPTPTLCPHSDIICPGGNETLSPAGQVMLLMASASAPEFGQLAQTATALYVSLTPSPTVPSNATNTPCAFMWAHQDLPEITNAAQAAFNKAKLDNINVIRADAYGETCGSRFMAMTTDFYLSAEVDNFRDTEAIGDIIRDAYNMLLALDVELPARHGYLDIEFTANGEPKRFRAMFSQIKSAVESEATGAALIKAGGGLG